MARPKRKVEKNMEILSLQRARRDSTRLSTERVATAAILVFWIQFTLWSLATRCRAFDEEGTLQMRTQCVVGTLSTIGVIVFRGEEIANWCIDFVKDVIDAAWTNPV